MALVFLLAHAGSTGNPEDPINKPEHIQCNELRLHIKKVRNFQFMVGLQFTCWPHNETDIVIKCI